MKKVIAIISVLVFAVLTVGAKTPVIGISGHNSGNESVANLSYLKSVTLAGGIPVILPVSLDDEVIDAMLSTVDGLIMTGGEDYDPVKWYGEEPKREMKIINGERDEFDVKMVRAAVAKGIPVLGICRGEQGLAVALGGSLWQDIPTDVAGNVKHNQVPTPSSYPTHSIFIEKGSGLASMFGVDKLVVNSFHHQAIKRMPKGLKAVAHAADGVVEAVERDGRIEGFKDGGAWIMGVQFHPEELIYAGDTSYLPIFKALVKEASK